MPDAHFSGSYLPEDVEFLLNPVEIAPTDVDEKERHIQSGTRHYSEMISLEQPPSDAYETIFEQAMERGAARYGREVAKLARAVQQRATIPVTLVSLVRAGAPLGVLLHRALKKLGVNVRHYGVSIIRDRGLDLNAIEHIARTTRRPIEGFVFVDGWTGKGAIATELESSFHGYCGQKPKLLVLADPCGRAWMAASGDDWLIPSGILGSTVSGLISRSILNEQTIEDGGFHGCKLWDHLHPFDRTRSFVDQVWELTLAALPRAEASVWTSVDQRRQRALSTGAIGRIAEHCKIDNLNRIKPGIAEATRAILRRKPERVFISSRDDRDLTALLHLAETANVPVELAPELVAPYRAITIIAKVT